MTAPARLLSVRLQGFKSFAERTLVTFGPGISAVVGPNGSGKSNLADALRWALGEQGRALRSRKSEDVIWAGSERRAAVGMADVQLSLDNADSLLPVEYRVVELGRRLYRSGENEYLLNRQRVRLRDLVDLLDSAHLAENAFLFIGQGMVDQALALRPEERRPLFEEVAGVRRHERRRRRAEEQLLESESNLARVEDILAELRPQARRLAAQAEQAASRASAGDDLVAALLESAHVRWHEAAARISESTAALETARLEVNAALDAQALLESAAADAAVAMDERARSAAELRSAADDARSELTRTQVKDAEYASERRSLARDRQRLSDERAAAEADLAVQRRRLAIPLPVRDSAAEASLSEAERELAAALAELAHLQGTDRARGADEDAHRRAAAARAAEAEQARRRVGEVERRLADEESRSLSLVERDEAVRAEHAIAEGRRGAAVDAEGAAIMQRETATSGWQQASADAAAAHARAGTAAAALAGATARLEAAAAAIEDDRASGFAMRMRERGARRLDEGIVVDPVYRAAIDAALAGMGRAYLTTRDGVRAHATERGLAIVIDGVEPGISEPSAGSQEADFVALVAGAGGGHLRDAIRRDGSGVVGRLLARAVWVPDLEAALYLQPHLPIGWVIVPRDGSAVVGDLTVRLGPTDGHLERRARHERALAEHQVAERLARETAEVAAVATAEATQARAALDVARSTEAAATGERRRAEESERLVARRLESVVREAAWHATQVERLMADLERARTSLPKTPVDTVPGTDTSTRDALVTWQARVVELRARRDRLAEQASELDATRRNGERGRAAAEASIALDESRMAAAERGLTALAERDRQLEAEADLMAGQLAGAVAREAQARGLLVALTEADSAERVRLGAAERAAATARDRLRAAEERARGSEHRHLEARLGLESLREQVLTELSGLGTLSVRHLAKLLPSERIGTEGWAEVAEAESGGDGSNDGVPNSVADDAVTELDGYLARAGAAWAAQRPIAPPPSPARLGSLRRRYHELGAANPLALDEYAEVRVRLELLSGQHADLRAAIDQTRSLIGELDKMISDQFRTTFAALETAFDRRFRQLFGGGFARLALTDAADLAATGIDIVARPPGKKAQALAMLSGGERALTAVALLFAMLEVRPVPFCVLDEVDAALDEANVGRFTAALRELAEATQFVVITHNRGTIEIADALYGVTVGDDSVSRVISLRLDEATAMAEAGASPAVATTARGAS